MHLPHHGECTALLIVLWVARTREISRTKGLHDVRRKRAPPVQVHPSRANEGVRDGNRLPIIQHDSHRRADPTGARVGERATKD